MVGWLFLSPVFCVFQTSWNVLKLEAYVIFIIRRMLGEKVKYFTKTEMGKPRWLLSSSRFCAHAHTPMILSTLRAQSSTPQWRPWETDHVETSEDNNPTHHVPNVHTRCWKIREGSDQLLNLQWQWDTTMPEVRATPSLSQQPSGEDAMITSLTEGYTEALRGQCIT